MTRGVALFCAVGVMAALTVEAFAEYRSGPDRRTGFGFELNGAALTVRVAPGKTADAARKQVFGQEVVALCTSSYDFALRSRVVRRMVWPPGQDALTFSFNRDISAEAKTCLLEGDGGADIAEVYFGPKPATLLVLIKHSGGRVHGVRSFIRLHDSRGRPVPLTFRPYRAWVVEPGRYRLLRYDRRCLRSCRTLGTPVHRCSRQLLLPSGLSRLAVIDVDRRSTSCRIHVSSVPGPRALIGRTIRSAVRSALDGDYARACRFGSRAGRRRLLEGFNSSSGPDFASCEAVLRDEVRTYPYVVRRLRRGVVISGLRVRGRRARARVADGKGQSAGSGHVSLRRIKGRWRIDNSDLIPYGD